MMDNDAKAKTRSSLFRKALIAAVLAPAALLAACAQEPPPPPPPQPAPPAAAPAPAPVPPARG
jgi:hypothetical protein